MNAQCQEQREWTGRHMLRPGCVRIPRTGGEKSPDPCQRVCSNLEHGLVLTQGYDLQDHVCTLSSQVRIASCSGSRQ